MEQVSRAERVHGGIYAMLARPFRGCVFGWTRGMRIDLVMPPCEGGAKYSQTGSEPDSLKRQIFDDYFNPTTKDVNL